MEQRRFLDGWETIPDIAKATGGRLTEHQIRYLIRERHHLHPGFNRCITKVGRSWLVNIDRLEQYLVGRYGEESDRLCDGM